MGKPFNKELQAIPGTVKWAFGEPVPSSLNILTSSLIQYPLIIVGSGGSLSGAQFVAQIHEQVTGKMAKAVTPLEFTFSQVDPTLHGVLFLTASGNNKDILGAFKNAVKSEFASIGVICAKPNSKIYREAKLYPHIQICEFTNPVGKDGFLAVNSLLSTCILTAKAYGVLDLSNNPIEELFELKTDFNTLEWDSVFQRKTLIALGAGWAWPALIDLESKFTEAALGNVILSDLRNFAHGRHNWFDKKGDESALLVLETAVTKKLAQKTMDFLPTKYPRAVLNSSFSGPMACLQLCIKVFQLVEEAGKRFNIDPGMPKVPEFGRKIYHIGLSPVISRKKKRNHQVWIKRKSLASNEPNDILENSLDKFLDTLKNTSFFGIVFDYDGTLCDLSERFFPLKKEVSDVLNNLLSRHIRIGIATGRGRSVQKNLKEAIDKKYWKEILVGNYNGAVILPLSEELPPSGASTSSALEEVDSLLREDLLLKNHTEIDTRPKQISVSFLSWAQKKSILERISERLSKFDQIKIVHSEHSIDILDSGVSKLNVLKTLEASIEKKGGNILVIGDQGQYGGNDFGILNQPYGLSVNRISTSLTSCWNLSPIGLRGSKATLSLLRAIMFEDEAFQIDVGRLEKEIVR